jgi:hypothetical protein
LHAGKTPRRLADRGRASGLSNVPGLNVIGCSTEANDETGLRTLLIQ